ncbi:helix-turn-helix domain-containing protein [Vibrio cholerae]|uniref:helix-turn-helix domain-containing protein n=1 Tax=Vibrio cholerae TaxID=666 RepID=UPI0029C3E698|nr:helix-turn-helix transcriptional regulator [Vibrio cholerae]MDX5010268.1 helix-turn-helix transcriptional regulator [Vibrio cholerae]
MSINNASFKSNFGEKLKAVRKRGGWSQAVLAHELGVSRDTLSRYERGELSPSLEVFSKMVDMFASLDINAESLLFGENGPSKEIRVIGSWGWAKGLSFAKGGAFKVGATKNDILRLTADLVGQLPQDNPFKTIVDDIKDYIYDLEDNYGDTALSLDDYELLVPIAHHSVSFKVELPDEKTKIDEIFDKYLSEKEKAETLQAEINRLTQNQKQRHVKQSIEGNNHTIAGNDITINKK